MTYVIPNIDEIPVTTKTIIANTGWILDIEKLFHLLPVVEYVIIKRKRGRKRKEVDKPQNNEIVDGSIITIKYKNKIKGVSTKKKKQREENINRGKRTYFRNSLTVVMIMGKHINFKISNNGSFQFTGCKNDEQARNCIKIMWDYIVKYREVCKNYDIIQNGFSVTFTNGLRNLQFSLGFKIDRISLNNYISFKCLDYVTRYQPDQKYAGVVIYFPIENIDEEKIILGTLTYKKIGIIDKWESGNITYKQYFSNLGDEDKKKELIKKNKKSEKNAFLVFREGNVILSGKYLETTRENYIKFWDLIIEARNIIEEKIEKIET